MHWCTSILVVCHGGYIVLWSLQAYYPHQHNTRTTTNHNPTPRHHFLCGVVWCGVVWCGVVWCGVVWCGVVWCGVVWCGVEWSGVEWSGVEWSCVVLCCIVLCCFVVEEGTRDIPSHALKNNNHRAVRNVVPPWGCDVSLPICPPDSPLVAHSKSSHHIQQYEVLVLLAVRPKFRPNLAQILCIDVAFTSHRTMTQGCVLGTHKSCIILSTSHTFCIPSNTAYPCGHLYILLYYVCLAWCGVVMDCLFLKTWGTTPHKNITYIYVLLTSIDISYPLVIHTHRLYYIQTSISIY